ncbi:hypothetical protein OSB04_008074 [Centaurea solstitialis]|uniref:C2H2-type domain-containing protein n=1 Tax=Centaurea solstitialis TaxID=347529 RepID=A0AA38TMS9_9ASTR|nr:hypothetical protein OSB04_008074 [Centaurea solstitialis]
MALPNDMYAKVNNLKSAKESAMNACEGFRARENETLTESYNRLNTYVNDLRRLGLEKNRYEINVKLLKNLGPKWQQVAVSIQLSQNLGQLGLHDLYSMMVQHEEIITKRNIDPLALVTKHQGSLSAKTTPSRYENTSNEDPMIMINFGNLDEDMTEVDDSLALLTHNMRKLQGKLQKATTSFVPWREGMIDIEETRGTMMGTVKLRDTKTIGKFEIDGMKTTKKGNSMKITIVRETGLTIMEKTIFMMIQYVKEYFYLREGLMTEDDQRVDDRRVDDKGFVDKAKERAPEKDVTELAKKDERVLTSFRCGTPDYDCLKLMTRTVALVDPDPTTTSISSGAVVTESSYIPTVDIETSNETVAQEPIPTPVHAPILEPAQETSSGPSQKTYAQVLREPRLEVALNVSPITTPSEGTCSTDQSETMLMYERSNVNRSFIVNVTTVESAPRDIFTLNIHNMPRDTLSVVYTFTMKNEFVAELSFELKMIEKVVAEEGIVPNDPEAEVIALSPKTLMATNRFLCEICGKGFQRDQNLQLHRRGHNLPWKLKQRSSKEVRKRVYVCPEKSCVHNHPSRALGDLTGIKKHFCRKHGEKKWKCAKCSKCYAVQSDWKAHSKTCGTREYKCDCGTIFSRRDSFITHRAFCDALAEETARVSAASHFNNNATTSAALGNLNYHYVGPPVLAGPTMAQHFSSIFKPISTNPQINHLDHHSTPQGALSLWTTTNTTNNNNSNSHDLHELDTSVLYAADPHDHQNQSDYHQSNWGGVFGVKTTCDHHQEVMASTAPSLFSSQNNSHQTHPTSSMSATALLQKAAQMGSTSSVTTTNHSSFLGTFGLKSGINNNTTGTGTDTDTQVQNVNKFCGLYGTTTTTTPMMNGGLGSDLENEFSSLDHLQMYPPSKRRHIDQIDQEQHHGGNIGGQTRDFLGVGIQPICHPRMRFDHREGVGFIGMEWEHHHGVIGAVGKGREVGEYNGWPKTTVIYQQVIDRALESLISGKDQGGAVTCLQQNVMQSSQLAITELNFRSQAR